MAFSESARINDGTFFYFPRFSGLASTRSVFAELFRNSQKSKSFDHEFASPSGVGSDEILEQLNDENYYANLSKVNNEENDGKMQYKRVLKRSDNLAALSRFGIQTRKEEVNPAFPSFTRVVSRSDNTAAADQNFPRAPTKPSESFASQKVNRQIRPFQRGDNKSDHITRGDRDLVRITIPYCAFCLSNGETETFYSSHPLKDAQNRVVCPILQKYVCPNCGATGQSAHTMKYCPENPTPLPKFKPIRRNASGKKVISYN